MPDHKAILNAETHEPKHITDTITSDTGKVITASSTTSGESEFRLLKASEVEEKLVTVNTLINDVSTINDTAWVCSPVAGTLQRVDIVIYGALSTADATLTVKINGIAVTLSTALQLEFSGSAAGDTASADVSSGGTLAAGDAIEILSDGASANVVNAQVTFYIKES